MVSCSVQKQYGKFDLIVNEQIFYEETEVKGALGTPTKNLFRKEADKKTLKDLSDFRNISLKIMHRGPFEK